MKRATGMSGQKGGWLVADHATAGMPELMQDRRQIGSKRVRGTAQGPRPAKHPPVALPPTHRPPRARCFRNRRLPGALLLPWKLSGSPLCAVSGWGCAPYAPALKAPLLPPFPPAAPAWLPSGESSPQQSLSLCASFAHSSCQLNPQLSHTKPRLTRSPLPGFTSAPPSFLIRARLS